MRKLNTIFLLIAIIAFFSIFVFILLAFINVVKKNKEKTTKMFKFSGIALAATIAAFVGFGVTSEEAEEAEPAAEEKREKIETSQSQGDKKENETEAANETEKAAEKLAAEKKYYLENVKTAVDAQVKMYDAAWNEFWQPTFEGIGSTVDIYTAYENMKMLEQRYHTLYSSFGAIDASGLSKENEKLFKEFAQDMQNASMWRKEVAKKASKMFDEGDYSPSEFEKMKTDIKYADNEMMTAIVSLTSLEVALGVDRNE